MRTPLESWFLQASYKLADESAGQVWAEIREHYDSARESAIAKGHRPDEADRLAVAELGDPQEANRQYRKVLLTVADLKWLARWRREEQIQPKFKFADLWKPEKWKPEDRESFWFCFLWPFVFRASEQWWGLGVVALLACVFRPARWGTPWPIFKSRNVRWLIVLAASGVLLQLGHIRACVILTVLAAYVDYRDDSLRRKLPEAQWPKVMRL